jgi:hypothetical protein
MLHAGTIESGDCACNRALPLADAARGPLLLGSESAFKLLVDVRTLGHRPLCMKAYLCAALLFLSCPLHEHDFAREW